MNTRIALYCKSYSTDVKRTRRLAESVQQFNSESLPFYVSCPQKDAPLFRDYLSGLPVTLIHDEDIVSANPKINKEQLAAVRGNLSQQVIKSEFWRLSVSDAYACIDSDSMFIRPFGKNDFILDDGTPYSVIDEGHELLDLAICTGRSHVVRDFMQEAERFKRLFGRSGRCYSFGPNPPIWHTAVWKSLDREFLTPRGMSFLDAILLEPIDLNWYGEALLKYKAIPLVPRQPLFKVYHYAWQLDKDRRARVTDQQLAQLYCGVIHQSAWDRQMDWPREAGGLGSRMARRLRRLLGRI
jgi:hypothetical protein